MRRISRNGKQKRRARIRKKVFGTTERPRLSVARSNRHIYAQIINDETGNTLAFISTLSLEGDKQSQKEKARLVGKKIAELAIKAGTKKAAFDRGGMLYHGCVKELADGAREAGLEV